jgi:hypothetical protein
MGYRDDLIARVKAQGIWSKLTGEQQAKYLDMSDEQAGSLMAMADSFDMRDEATMQQIIVASMNRFLTLFDGALVEATDQGWARLSTAGLRFAEFIAALKETGLTEVQMEAGLREFDTFMLATLMALYRCPP